MTRLERHRYQARQELTVMDGFRIGLGMFIFQLCAIVIIFAFCFITGIGAAMLLP